MEPLVSVVIPTYNRESTLLRSINSVLNQTYKNIEILIIDDGSTDNTKELVEKIEDSRVFYYANEHNMGCAFTKDRGIQLAKGEYIAFQDSDDEWLPLKLEHQMRVFVADESAGMVYCKVRKMYPSGLQMEWPDEQIPKEELSGDIYKRLILTPLCSTQTTIVRRKCLEQIGGIRKDLKSYEDYEMSIRMAHKFPILFVDEVLAFMYDSPNSVNKRLADILMVQCMIMKDNAEELLDNDLVMVKLKFELQEIAIWGEELELIALKNMIRIFEDAQQKSESDNSKKKFVCAVWKAIIEDVYMRKTCKKEEELIVQRDKYNFEELYGMYLVVQKNHEGIDTLRLIAQEMVVKAFEEQRLIDLKAIYEYERRICNE